MPVRYGFGRDGRPLGAGVVRESGGAGGDGSAGASGSGATKSPAGTSDAVVSVSSTRENGPDPIGCRPNGSSASSSTGTPASRWAGASGWVSAWRKPPSGVCSEKTTRCGPSALTVTSLHDEDEGPVYEGSWSVSMVKTTSSLVTGSPSCQRASSRRSTVHVRPLASTDQRSARSGTMVPAGPLRSRPEKSNATRSRSTCVRAVNGVTDTGAPSAPSMYGRVSAAGPLAPGAGVKEEVDEES